LKQLLDEIESQLKEQSNPTFKLDISELEECSLWWISLVGFTMGFCAIFSEDHPACVVLMYCLSQADRVMNPVETALWMLVAYREYSKAVIPGSSITNDSNWIPKTSEKGLTTTRYFIIDALKLSVDSVLKSINLEMFGIFSHADKYQRSNARDDIRLFIHFAGYFGFIQYKLLAAGIEPEDIVEHFARLSIVKKEFNDGLPSFN